MSPANPNNATPRGGTLSEGEAGYPKKRARTRAQLMHAGMIVLARRGPDGATVGEIAGEAGVASGTFYNHFPSLIDLVEEIAGQLQMTVEIASTILDSIENDPAIRVAIGSRQLLLLSSEDPAGAAAFVSLLAAIPTFRLRIRTVILGTVESGIEAGRFDVASAASATDAVLGAVVQWMRSDLADESGEEQLDDRVSLLLRLLGLAKRDVGKTIKAAAVTAAMSTGSQADV
ncbi:MAG: AcrR family transcriptional regulator [Acidimicrobiales bacterium]|jgi:AcrR family transcriptional regulator